MKNTAKKVLLSAFALTTALSLAACGNTAKTSKYKDLVVESLEFSGDFFTGNFSNSSFDVQVINLLSSTSTIDQTGAGKFVINKGIVTDEKLNKSTDANGNTVVTWHLRKDLKWSDGQAITAKDYVFGLLFQYSKAWSDVGAQVVIDDAFVGFGDYAEGKTDTLSGVKLVDDHTFSITISKDSLPYFFEMSYYAVGALPMHELAKGATIKSSDAGVKLEGVELAKVAEEVKKTQVDSKKPTVTYGKYLLDKSSETELVFKINPNYVGNHEGVKPTIQTITLKAYKENDLSVQRLQKGEVDFVPKLVDAKLINAAKADKNLGTINYARNGYGYLAMANDFGPTKDVNVRRALGHLTNRNKLITDVLEGYGIAINGQYALAQWMAKDKEADLNSKLNKYSYDVNLANEELNKSTYKFEADGTTPFDVTKASATYLRYNANKEPLVIKHLATDNNPISTSLETGFVADAPKVGMKYEITKTDFPTLLKNIKLTTAADAQQQYHLYNLASNFTGAVVDPYNAEHSKNLGTQANAYRINDAQIDKLSEEMRKLDASQTEEFANKWLAYQVRFNEILPFLPLYSNTYYDAFSAEKVDKDPTTAIRDWATQVEYFRLK